MKRKPINLTLQRLAQAEEQFLAATILAPVVRRQGVRVRIAGVRCTLKVSPDGFEGWAILRADSYAVASVIRPATMAERRRYLDVFPAVRLVCWRRTGRDFEAVPAQAMDERFEIAGDVSIALADSDVQLFDTVITRFDGQQFWFDEVDSRCDPAAAVYLRQSLLAMIDPARLDRPGLVLGQRIAYATAHRQRVEARLRDERRRIEVRLRDERQYGEERLRDALKHAGATLTDFAETGHNAYRVAFSVDGRRHTSVVRKGDLRVESAGICLSGLDNHFDLKSLVGVLREGSDSRAH